MQLALTVLIYVVSGFLALLQALIVWKMANNDIDLKFLIADAEGYASLSRFQFLIFTFVIGVGVVYLTVQGEAFPKLDHGVLVLLGISGASYALGKGLDNKAQSDDKTQPDNKTQPKPNP